MERIYSQGFYNKFGSGQLEPDVRDSLAYRQASSRGRTQMRAMANMRLPTNTDPNRVRYEGSNYNTGQPLYSAPMPQPWGTWGALSGPAEKEETPAATPTFPSDNAPTPEKAAPEGYMYNKYGYLEKDYSKEGYNKNQYGYWNKTNPPEFPDPAQKAAQPASTFPYMRPKPAYDLGESRGYGSFSNYPTYGPSPL